jgi:hypothetical protein
MRAEALGIGVEDVGDPHPWVCKACGWTRKELYGETPEEARCPVCEATGTYICDEGDVPCSVCGEPTGLSPSTLKYNGATRAVHYECNPIEDPGP